MPLRRWYTFHPDFGYIFASLLTPCREIVFSVLTTDYKMLSKTDGLSKELYAKWWSSGGLFWGIYLLIPRNHRPKASPDAVAPPRVDESALGGHDAAAPGATVEYQARM